MQSVDSPSAPEADTQTGGPPRCPACGHEAVGRPPSRFARGLARALRMRELRHECPAWARDGGVGDAQQCWCRHPAHAGSGWTVDVYDYERDVL